MRLSKGWRRFQRELGPPLRMLPPYITPARGEQLYDPAQRVSGSWWVVGACAVVLAVIEIVLHFKGVR